MAKNPKYVNISSVSDLGTFFSRLYRHALVGAPYDRQMIELLGRQKDMECFPKVLPDFEIAHKTGELAGIYDDGGIFYGKSGDFVLVVMSENYEQREIAIDKMQKISLAAAKAAVALTKQP